LVCGHTISLWTQCSRQWQLPPSQQPSLQGSQAVVHPPLQAPELSQHPPLLAQQMGVTPGMQISLHLQQYLCTVSFFVSHVGWQQASSRQPQRGQ
jgi:hypothetical protein